MMKRIITLFAHTLCILTLCAQPRSESEARSVAQDFFGNVAESRGETVGETNLSLVSSIEIAKAIGRDIKHTKRASSASSVNVGFYIFNDDVNHRFVIVSGDERQYETLGNSDNGVFDPANIPCGLLTFLEQYANEYDYLQESEENGVATEEASEVRDAYSSTDYMIKTKWDQDKPYNYLCPIVNGNQFCLTGCVATAMAQVMNYYQYPERGEGIVYIMGGKNNLPYESLDLSTHPFEWNYLTGAEIITTNSSSDRKFAVAELMRACGYAIKMDYGTSNQGGSTASSANVPYVFSTYFGYDRNATYLAKSNYSLSKWESLIQNELSHKRPIIYRGQGSDGGHSFILCGYRSSDGKYYFNWGWSGSYNGYYPLSSLSPGSSSYTSHQGMAIGLQPSPEVNIEKPVITIDRDFDVATISCSTAEANLYYSFTPQDQSYESSYSRYYGSKIDITCNGTFRAYAELKGKRVYATEQKVTWFVVSKPEFYPDGNKLTIKCPSATAIYYTKNGQYPTKNSTRYTGPITCTNGMTVKAIGVKANYSDSYIATYEYKEEIKTVYDFTNTAGQISKKINEASKYKVISLTLSGQLNGTDIKFIGEMLRDGELSRVDMKNASIVSGGDSYYASSDYTTNNVIGEHMFWKSSKLTSFILPSNITEIGDDAFQECPSLTSITIPENCKKIGVWAFRETGITSLTIPQNVNEIGWGIIQGCKYLKNLSVDKNNKSYDSRDDCNAIINTAENTIIAGCIRTIIPNTVEEIEMHAFCSSPKVLYIPGNVRKISNGAFEDNIELEEITMEEGVRYIYSNVFSGCTGLRNVTIPASVWKIYEEAFKNCSSLRTFTTYAETPVMLGNDVFTGSNYKSATLRVPYGCKSKYQSAAVWRDFKTIEEMPIVVKSIAEVKTLADGQYATLKLDEAQVTYAYQDVIDYVYLRDKTGAAYLFGDVIEILNVKAGDIISGEIPVKLSKTGGIQMIDYQFEPRHFSVTGHQTVVPKTVTPEEVGNLENDCDLVSVENVVMYGSADYLYFNASGEKSIWVLPISGLKPEDYDAILASTRNVDINGKKYNLIGIPRRQSGFYLTQPLKEGDPIQTISIDATNFPDKNFRNYLLSQSYGKDGVLTESEISKVSKMNINFKEISNLKGIEFFTALKSLDCYFNQLTSLDVSKNTALTSLDCFSNKLTSLDVSKNTALTSLDCSYNELTTLDLSKNTELNYLSCSGNQLASLDVSKNTELWTLSCSNNKLTILDVSKNAELFYLSCGGNIIRGAAMDDLINGLPQNTTSTEYTFMAINPQDKNEGNVCTKSQVAAVKAKGWFPCYYDSETESYIEYEGSDPSAISSPLIQTDKSSSAVFSLSGQRLVAPRKGVNIVDGKKIIMK